jgi:UDP-N-acetylglucosamine--N-acetylmuramyl-(pentapeptide) pyrophosphoryl-undecaprenol N-acetylglucosamine transferase
MKVLLAVGGGGHFSAALSVIERMPKDWEILLVGRKYAFEGDKALAFEYQTAKRLNLPYRSITAARLQRRFTRHSLISFVKVPVGLVQANTIVRKFNPDVVLSFGGYISVSVVLAAASRKIPIVIHEQIMHAGLANKIASRFANTVCISWAESKKFFPKNKTVLTGNPLRKEFLTSGRREQPLVSEAQARRGTEIKDKSLPLLYITGGSGGAHGINVLIEGCLIKLLEKYKIIHQTGDAKLFGDFDRLEKFKATLPESLQKRYTLQKFITSGEVMSILTKADLIISRSGISTVTELLYLGKPSLLIPLPYGQHNEQLTNAQLVKKVGLGEIIDQLKTTPDQLFIKIATMMSTLVTYKKNERVAKVLIHTDAAEKIIAEVRKVVLQ